MLTSDLQLDDPAVLGAIDNTLRELRVEPAGCFRTVRFDSPLESGTPVSVTVRCSSESTLGMGTLLPGIGIPLNLGTTFVVPYEKAPTVHGETGPGLEAPKTA